MIVKENDIIMYKSYFKKTGNLAAHIVEAISDEGYLYVYDHSDDLYPICRKDSNDFCELNEYFEKYPEDLLRIQRINGREQTRKNVIKMLGIQ